MKVSELTQIIEKVVQKSVRQVVREEVEYYFNKLQEQIQHNSPIVETRTNTSIPRNGSRSMPPASTPSRKTTNNKPALQEKYRNILTEMVFEETEPFGEEENVDAQSILDENKLRALSNSQNLQSVHKALTRDYSALVNQWNSEK